MNGLQFGVFLSPRADGIGRLLDNAHAAQEAGFDFISVQDHPYVPDFLDTFALIGALIGQTDRIGFMTNVTNLPLRPPQMLAKASASLDLLSGGRFELGLGAGRAWPQIAGLGGPLRNPAEALGATAEAIDVLRALWLPGRPADLPGRYYPVRAEGGPAPAHRIGIWLGAIGPRMLDLAGRKADGWIAPLATGYETKPAAQDRIDAAARAAGRDPAGIRRAMVTRDRGCAFPGCDRPPAWCDGHHIQHWADGGPTALANLVLLCGHHHRTIHHHGWQARIDQGLPEFIPPPWIDPGQTPRRNRLHDLPAMPDPPDTARRHRPKLVTIN